MHVQLRKDAAANRIRLMFKIWKRRRINAVAKIQENYILAKQHKYLKEVGSLACHMETLS